MKIKIYILVLLLVPGLLYGQRKKRYTIQDYIETYKEIAVAEMHRGGIPASITLAQGSLESDNGNSRLAAEGNNHFGIKCHDWNGKTITEDDETRNECFRKYASAEESFRDHTDFLRGKSRYSFLFTFETTDYKKWARGLKEAGYATNPSYPQLLIKIIEDNKLYNYDQVVFIDKPVAYKPKHKTRTAQEDEFSFRLKAHEVFERNRIQYIVVKEGDTFGKLADELELMRWELPKYNDLTSDSALRAGEILYLQPKRNRAPRGHDTHVVKSGESMRSISQLYGVKLARLYKMNCMVEGEQPVAGDTLNLRKKKKCQY